MRRSLSCEHSSATWSANPLSHAADGPVQVARRPGGGVKLRPSSSIPAYIGPHAELGLPGRVAGTDDGKHDHSRIEVVGKFLVVQRGHHHPAAQAVRRERERDPGQDLIPEGIVEMEAVRSGTKSRRGIMPSFSMCGCVLTCDEIRRGLIGGTKVRWWNRYWRVGTQRIAGKGALIRGRWRFWFIGPRVSRRIVGRRVRVSRRIRRRYGEVGRLAP